MPQRIALRRWIGAVLLAVPVLLIGCSQGSSGRVTANKPVAEQPPSLDAEPSAAKTLEEKNEDVAEGGTESTAINPNQQLVQIKALSPEKVRVGEAYDYEIHVTNTSEKASVSHVKVQHTLPEGFEIESSKPEAEIAEKSATWTLAQLSPGETQKIHIRGLSDDEGASNACLSVTYTPTVCLTTQFVRPDLEVAKQAPDHSRLCDPIQITYRVTNHGTGMAKNVEVTDELPEGMKTAEGQQTVSFTVEELPPGKSQEFQATVVASQPGEFSSRAVAKAEGGEETRSSEATTTVQAAQLDATIEGPSAEYVGRMLTYTINVQNTGKVPAKNATLRMQPPEGLQLRWKSAASKSGEPSAQATDSSQQTQKPTPASQPPKEGTEAATNNADKPGDPEIEAVVIVAEVEPAPADAGGLNWQLGTLRPGESATARVSFVGRKAGEVEVKAIANFDCATGEKEAQATASAQTNLIALPAIAVAVADTPDPVKVGEEVRYIITVVNEGNADDKQVKVTATLPESLEHIDHAGVSKGTLEGQTLTFETIEILKPGEEAAWTVRAKAKSAGNSRLTVNVSSEGQDQATAEEPTRLFDASEASDSGSEEDAAASESSEKTADQEPTEQ